ncbi:unnamed protein product [Clavelina lepadiformis]|uniref:MRN complex-interacting protein N-terminal domain-containing protein n=1 Tax=Clavelina lepadiformis TaxID=159417 RepID=A0ABP0H1L0_CLALP
MPSEFVVVNCCDCGTYQIHPTKKGKKWSCKMCGLKQSYNKIHFEGHALECRKLVQTCNMQRGLNKEQQLFQLPQCVIKQTEHNELPEDNLRLKSCKWLKYKSSNETSSSEEDAVDEKGGVCAAEVAYNSIKKSRNITSQGNKRKIPNSYTKQVGDHTHPLPVKKYTNTAKENRTPFSASLQLSTSHSTGDDIVTTKKSKWSTFKPDLGQSDSHLFDD